MSKQKLKLDANETAFLQQELEDIDETDFEEMLPGLLARRYIPDIAGIAEFAETYSYDMWKLHGKAKVISGNADDLPRSTATKTRASTAIKKFGGSYGWTFDEIQAAAGTGTPLDRMTVLAARTASDQQTDTLLAVGDSDLGIEGLLTLSDVDIVTLANAGTWASKIAADNQDQVIADITKLIRTNVEGLKQAENVPGFQKFVLLIPVAQYADLALTPRSATSDTTILQFVLQNAQQWLESIEPWDACNGAGAGGLDRAVLYPRNPLCLGAVVPREFTQLGPQERNLEIVVPCISSCGGVVCRYPVAVKYMDGI